MDQDYHFQRISEITIQIQILKQDILLNEIKIIDLLNEIEEENLLNDSFESIEDYCVQEGIIDIYVKKTRKSNHNYRKRKIEFVRNLFANWQNETGETLSGKIYSNFLNCLLFFSSCNRCIISR